MDMMKQPSLPLVGLPADTAGTDGLIFHKAGDKYVRAVAEVPRCATVVIPSTGEQQLDGLLDHFSGIVLTGGLSNVHPPRYGAESSPEHEPFDHERDATTLALIGKVLARGIPLLCICRGFQELNVALGGTLEGEVQRGEGRLDHRAPTAEALDARYGPVHDIDLTPGGRLEAILGSRRIRINSLHRQAVAQLSDRLAVEAVAPDGVVEAAVGGRCEVVSAHGGGDTERFLAEGGSRNSPVGAQLEFGSRFVLCERPLCVADAQAYPSSSTVSHN